MEVLRYQIFQENHVTTTSYEDKRWSNHRIHVGKFTGFLVNRHLSIQLPATPHLIKNNILIR